MNIAEVSKKFDLSQDTLRYYERIGLIPAVKRNTSGNRDYTEEDCNWIHFIKCMRSVGLSIETLIEYVSMVQKGDSTVKARKELLSEQRAKLEEKRNEIEETITRLDRKIEDYDKKLGVFEDSLKKVEQETI